MNKPMSSMWEERYSDEEYAYGKAPNVFFKETLDQYLTEGKILMPAEGEGRNAVYAAKKGLDVVAFDTSHEGRNKSLKLAKEEDVKIEYAVGDFFELPLIEDRYDAAALIYAHFSPPILSKYYQKIGNIIKPNGLIILEGFSKTHLAYQKTNPKVGGPKQLDMLFTTDFILEQFSSFKTLQIEEVEVELNEGKYHIGTASVIRYVGRKIG